MSTLLQDYLRRLPADTDIAAHFRETFGVAVKTEGDLHLFKYLTIGANWSHEVTRECRGTIVRKLPDGGWEVVSRPFDKFFNLHQGHCPVFERAELERRLPACELMEKADGTCIQLWWDEVESRWRASTLGMITTGGVPEQTYSFAELFFRTACLGMDSLLHSCTYVFELCCDENRIVTKYDRNHVVILAVRRTLTGDYLPRFARKRVSETSSHILMPRLVAAPRTRDELVALVERESEQESDGLQYPEGFVLYHAHRGEPLAKLKNQRYLALHHTGGGDIGHSKNKIIDAVFLGFLDDIYEPLSDRLKGFADEMVAKAQDLTDDAVTAHNRLLEGAPYPTRKDVAMAIQDKTIPQEIRSFFFRNIPAYMTGEVSEFFDKFALWLKQNYSKMDWKAKRR